MKRIFTLALLALAIETGARVFYVSPTGNDNNPGSIAQPFRTWERLSSVLIAGDTAYIRGGTYRITKSASIVNRIYWSNMNGTATDSIKIWNFPGETPIANFDDQLIPGTAGDGPVGLKIENCSYLSIRGLRITGLAQNPAGINIPTGMILYNCDRSLIRNVEVDNIGGYGIYLQNSSDNNYFLNCDVHHCADQYTGWENANGFNCTGGDLSTNNTFDGCRAWWIGDDGFDFFGTNGVFILKNCWAFWNGYRPGTFIHEANMDGDGFKLGPCANDQSANMLRTLTNCLSFENYAFGFDQNAGSGNTCRMTLYNNTAFNNGGAGFFFGANTSIQQIFKNNVSNSGVNGSEIQTGPNVSNNSWNGGSLLTMLDFLSVSSIGVDGPRQADGSLPALNFLQLSPLSSLIDAGVNVGLPYNGLAPDKGAFESGGPLPPPNLAPTANAGPDRTITLPTNSLTLNGSGSDPDGTIIAYQWTKIAGPSQFTIVSPNAASTNITGLLQGQYTFRLTVTDNGGLTASDDVIVTVNTAPPPNQPPTANAGPDRTITLPTNSVTLNGSGSDPDGTITAYQWSKIAGPSQFTISSPASASTNITGLVQGQYTFRLTVTDNGGLTGSDDVIVTVNAAAPSNQPPTANAGPDRTITLPTNNVALNGSGSDPDGTITAYQWSKIAGPSQFTIVSPASASTNITSLVQGQYTFRLTVTDNGGLTASDDVIVTVNAATPPNQPPTANAGADRTITLPTNSVTLNGSGSDPDGTITAYQWSKIAGPSQFTIVSPANASTNITGLVQGQYTFRLTVTDNGGLTASDDVIVIVNAVPVSNQKPKADAGSNKTLRLPTKKVRLTGSGTDNDGTIIAYQWSKIAGPAQYTILARNANNTDVDDLTEGTYAFELTVTDNAGDTGKDTVSVTVLAASGTRPGYLDFTVYPNPATTSVNARMAFDSSGENFVICIYDIRGVKVYQSEKLITDRNGMVYPIDITRFQSGHYIIRLLFNDDRKIVEKFIKL